MEVLNEQDLDWLAKAEGRLYRMRKREAANTNSSPVINDLTDVIEKIHQIKEWLQSRLT